MNESNQTSPSSSQLRFTDERFIWRFSPNQTDPELLEAIFVGREPLLQNVLEKIADSASSVATHNVLIYGPRGIGKSHLTSLLHHRLVTDDNMSDAVHIAWLNEDETTTSMVQLLVRIYRSLCKWYPNEYSSEWLNGLLNQSREEVSDVLTRRLVERFKHRRLVILVENLNLLFENLGSDGQHELRTLLQENPFACLIATSQQLFREVADRSEPFFGFFQQIPLKPLSLHEAHSLLVKIAQTKGQDDLVRFLGTPDGRGRVRAIHDLAGGNHRVYIVMSGFVTRESLDQLVAPFQKMADDLTPYYQERLRWISPLQRQIVELLCREHGTVNPKEIARRLLVDQRSVGKQVRTLEKIGYLTSTKRGRETFYELSEPLMRLAYEVKEQSLLQMLIEFLRIWYRPDEMKRLRAGGMSQTLSAYMDAAWKISQTTADPRLKLLQQELEKAEYEGRSHELAALWEEKAAASNEALDWFQAGYYFNTVDNDSAAALTCYENALEKDPRLVEAWSNKGNCLKKLGHHENAIFCYEKAINIDPANTPSWINKGNALNSLGRYEDALCCFEKALKIGSEDSHAFCNKGNALSHLGRYVDAIQCYDKALRLNPKDAYALNNKGLSLHRLGHFRDALRCFDNVTDIDPKHQGTWNNKGIALASLGRYTEALDCYCNEIANDPANTFAWNNKGNVLIQLGLYEDAIQCYGMATSLAPKGACWRFNRSEALFAMRRWEEGFDAIRNAFAESQLDDLGDTASMLSLIFCGSDDHDQLQFRTGTLIDLYQLAAEVHGFRKPANLGDSIHISVMSTTNDSSKPNHSESVLHSSQPQDNPLTHLGDGLVKSLGKIDAEQLSQKILESYVKAVALRVEQLPEFEIPLRLFRYGIRYLISGNECEFVELIQPERRILRQALNLPEES